MGDASFLFLSAVLIYTVQYADCGVPGRVLLQITVAEKCPRVTEREVL